MSRKLILIASYPKSGNTWVRIFFANLLNDGGQPVSINRLDSGFYGQERRIFFDAVAPANAADLLPAEIDNVLPEMFAAMADREKDLALVKVHDSARQVRDGRWLFPPDRVKAVLHLVRHPFDVAVSYAHHLGISSDDAAALLCDEEHLIADASGKLPLPLCERPGSWATHTESWIASVPFPVTTVRYEDLLARPAETFGRLVEAAGISPSQRALSAAMSASSFLRLQEEERQYGFRERAAPDRSFFREGSAGGSAGALSAASRDAIMASAKSVMPQFGYSAEGATLDPVQPHS